MKSTCHLWLAASLLHAAAAAADIHRCTGDDGEPLFSQTPCGGVVTSVGPARPAAAASGLRDGERAWLAERAKQRRASRDKPRKSRRADAGKQDYRCREKRRALDAVSARLRRGYKPAAGERLRQRRDSYEDYLATFCS